MPSTLGSFRSSRIRRGNKCWGSRPNRKSSASCPSRATWILLLSFSLRRACKHSSTSSALSSTKRISTSSCCGIKHLVLGVLEFLGAGSDGGMAQSKKECRTVIGSGVGPHCSTMLVNDAGDRGQPDTCPLELFAAMQSLEYAKKFVGESHLEANPVVTNVDRNPLLRHTAAHFNARMLASAREFCGIPQK